MIFPEKMLRVEISIPEDFFDEEVANLAKAGVLHIDKSFRTRVFERDISRVESLLGRLRELAEVLDVELSMSDVKIRDISSEIEKAEERISRLYEKIGSLETQLRKLSEDLREAEAADTVLNTITEVDLRKLAENLRFIKIHAFLFPTDTLEQFLMSVRENKAFAVHAPVSQGTSALALFCTDDVSDTLRSVAQKLSAKEVRLRCFITRNRKALEQRRNLLKEQKAQMREVYGREIRELYSILYAAKRLLELEDFARKEGKVYVIRGWIPKRHLDKLKRSLKHSSVVFEEAKRDAPVLFRTPKWLKPFEDLVLGFSHPNYREINPSLFVALTFVVFFGAMFGDVGHGLVLAISGYILSKKTETFKSFGKVLIAAGASSAIFGVFYGSVFGFEDLIHPLLFNPMEDINKLLLMSVIFGVVALSIGFVLNIINKFRSREYGKMLAGEGGVVWFLVYWLIIGMIIKAFVYKTSVMPELLAATFLILLGMAYEIYEKRSVVGSVLDAFMAVLESITGTVSFVRVGAFALAHAALLLAVFTIARAVSSAPRHGLLWWLVIVLGNIIVIVLEALVVSIQTMRLEYYEFFGRFFEGGGVPYKPFTLEGEK